MTALSPITAATPVADPHAPVSNPRRAAAVKASQEFEAVFASAMAKLMMESVAVDGEFGGGHGEEMFRGMMAEKIGEDMARSGGMGIAPAVLDQIIRLQGEAP